jgi:hypothetical protein
MKLIFIELDPSNGDVIGSIWTNSKLPLCLANKIDEILDDALMMIEHDLDGSPSK